MFQKENNYNYISEPKIIAAKQKGLIVSGIVGATVISVASIITFVLNKSANSDPSNITKTTMPTATASASGAPTVAVSAPQIPNQ